MVLVAQCLGFRVSEIVGLKWEDFDFDRGTVLVQRSVVHGRVDSVKTEYSQDLMPLDPALAALILEWRSSSVSGGLAGWVFGNPATGRPYHQEQIQKRFLKPAGEKAGLGFSLVWQTFRHTHRAWLDDSGAPMTVQQQLMRHASIQTTMNVYGEYKEGGESEDRADGSWRVQKADRNRINAVVFVNRGFWGLPDNLQTVQLIERIGCGGLQCTERAGVTVPV